jgi:hypothetical protein
MPRWVVVLRACALLIALRALTNVFKPFGTGTAFVFFGAMLRSTAGLWLASAVGVLMLVYAWGAWNLRRWALPMGVAYAVFVVLNIALFAMFQNVIGQPQYWILGAVFAFIGVGVTATAAYLLYSHRDELAE